MRCIPVLARRARRSHISSMKIILAVLRLDVLSSLKLAVVLNFLDDLNLKIKTPQWATKENSLWRPESPVRVVRALIRKPSLLSSPSTTSIYEFDSGASTLNTLCSEGARGKSEGACHHWDANANITEFRCGGIGCLNIIDCMHAGLIVRGYHMKLLTSG